MTDPDDRIAARFDDDDSGDRDTEREQRDQHEQHDQREQRDMDDKRDVGDRWVSSQNVKQEWENVLMYLPDDPIRSDLNDGWSRAQLNYDLDIKKTRHYYPAVILAGLEAIEDMPQDEFEEILDQIE